MANNELKQLIIMLYEYIARKGAKFESDYYRTLDEHYSKMFAARPELYVNNNDLLQIIQQKAVFESYVKIQKEIYEILALYKDTAFGGDSHDQE